MKLRILSIVMVMFLLTINISGASFSGGFPSSTVKSIYYYCGSNSSCGNYFNSSAESWNNISPNVRLRGTGDSSKLKIRLVPTSTTTPGLYGYLKPMKSGNVQAQPNEKWTSAFVYVYENNANTLSLRKETAVHEVGHALSMAHTSTYDSVMNANTFNNRTKPLQYDKNELIKRWK